MMKKSAAAIAVLFLGLVLTAELPGATVSRLRCEYRDNPLGIDVVRPRLSWTIESDQRSQRQTAYQILVSSSPEKLSRDEGDLWDSGKVASDCSTQVDYEGKPLSSHQWCLWKVRIWDGRGQPQAWIAAAQWSMGILDAKAWKAQWIGRDDARAMVPDDGKNHYLPCTHLRKDFTLSKPLRCAVLYVTSQGVVEPRLNGRKVGDDFLVPGWTDYHKRIYYRAYDVTPQVRQGVNTLAAILGDGWFRGRLSIIGQNLYGRKARLLAELHGRPHGRRVSFVRPPDLSLLGILFEARRDQHVGTLGRQDGEWLLRAGHELLQPRQSRHLYRVVLPHGSWHRLARPRIPEHHHQARARRRTDLGQGPLRFAARADRRRLVVGRPMVRSEGERSGQHHGPGLSSGRRCIGRPGERQEGRGVRRRDLRPGRRRQCGLLGRLGRRRLPRRTGTVGHRVETVWSTIVCRGRHEGRSLMSFCCGKGQIGVPWPNLFGHAAFFPASMHMPTQAWAWHPTFRNRN